MVVCFFLWIFSTNLVLWICS